MSWFRANNFFDSVRPVYHLTRIFFLNFDSLDFNQQTIQRTLLGQIQYFATVLVDLSLIYRSITVNTPYLRLTDSVLLNVGSYMTLVMLSLMTSSLSMWNRYKVLEILEICTNINQCDGNLKSLGIVIDHQKQYRFSMMYVVCWMGVPVIITMNAVFARINKAWTSVSSTGADVVTVLAILRTASSFSLFLCYCSLTLMSINSRLVKVQRILEKCLEGALRSRSVASWTTIRKIAAIHDHLSDIIRLFNSCYSIHVLQSVTMSVVFTIFVVFQLIHAAATNSSDEMLQVARHNIVYDAFYILIFVLMSVLTSLVGRNCKRVAMMIYKIVCYGSYDQQVFRELRYFAQQLDHHTPKITCNMFDFDWSLFYWAAGTFTTYLVILLQFDVSNLGFHRHQGKI